MKSILVLIVVCLGPHLAEGQQNLGGIKLTSHVYDKRTKSKETIDSLKLIVTNMQTGDTIISGMQELPLKRSYRVGTYHVVAYYGDFPPIEEDLIVSADMITFSDLEFVWKSPKEKTAQKTEGEKQD